MRTDEPEPTNATCFRAQSTLLPIGVNIDSRHGEACAAKGNQLKICVFRHGIAIDRMSPDCPLDADRMLTREGIEKTMLAARGLAHLGVEAGAVYSSAYRRARETAKLACEALGVDPGSIRETDALLPFASGRDFLSLLAHDLPDSALCAGHCPHMDDLVAAALGIEFPICTLKKAGAALIEWNPRRGGELLWLLQPKALRRLGGES